MYDNNNTLCFLYRNVVPVLELYKEEHNRVFTEVNKLSQIIYGDNHNPLNVKVIYGTRNVQFLGCKVDPGEGWKQNCVRLYVPENTEKLAKVKEAIANLELMEVPDIMFLTRLVKGLDIDKLRLFGSLVCANVDRKWVLVILYPKEVFEKSRYDFINYGAEVIKWEAAEAIIKAELSGRESPKGMCQPFNNKMIEIPRDLWKKICDIGELRSTQDRRATAEPVYYCVEQDEWIPAYPGCGDRTVIRDDEGRIIDDIVTEINEYAEDDPEYYVLLTDNEATKIREWEEKGDYDSLMELLGEFGNYYLYEESKIKVHSNAFFTAAACQQYIDSNIHNLPGNPVTYAEHAYRNPEMKCVTELIDAIYKFSKGE